MEILKYADTKTILLVIGVFIFLAIIFVSGEFLKIKNLDKPKNKYKYKYKIKKYLMTKSEHECYDVLLKIMGDKYFVFPQVHISSFLNHKIKGQSFRGAFSHINQKSVDFLICDKIYITPKLAIELDDKTHEREDRIERDVEVERVFEQSELPLLRIKKEDYLNLENLTQKLKIVLLD